MAAIEPGYELTKEEIEKIRVSVDCVSELMDPPAWFDLLIDKINGMIGKRMKGK